MKYKEDYKTDDPRWVEPPRKALLGKEIAICFKRLNRWAKIPEYKSSEAAGMDLSATEAVVLPPGRSAIVSTGLAMSLPKGFEAQIRPRSGLAAKYGITVLNSPGTIDSDYRGELKVILINHSQEEFAIASGDRIAQMVIARVEQPSIHTVETLEDTERGDGGLGSTGYK